MHLTNKILIGFLAFLSLFFMILAARVLKTQDQYRRQYNQTHSSLLAAQQQHQTLVGGSGPENPGLMQLKSDLHKVTVGRGDVWREVTPGQIDAATQSVPVTVGGAAPLPLPPDRVVYAFGDREAGHGYLGEFRVTGVNANQATLVSVSRLSPQEMERLAASPAPWTLYSAMPADSHEIFAGLPDEELNALLPEQVREEYRRDQKAADPNDPPERVVDGTLDGQPAKIYDRQLRDYVGEIHEFSRLRSIYLDRIAAALKDKEYLSNAITNGEQTMEFRKQQIADTKATIDKTRSENQAVVNHRKSLETQLADVRNSIEQLAAENDRLAARLAEFQFNRVGVANGRTARAGTGGR